MTTRIYIILIALCCLTVAKAQDSKAERAYVHLDKDCYLAGENVWFKFFVTNEHLTPSILSKVGYIEICDTEKPLVQRIVVLDNGMGTGKIKIPSDIPSGIYRLYGYTRFMRNEEEKVFFSRDVAIINMEQTSITDQVAVSPANENYRAPAPQQPATIRVSTDKNEYANRAQVELKLDNLPGNIVDLTVSVFRDDSIAYLPPVNKTDWLKQVKSITNFPAPNIWIPEYEGHILTGYTVTTSGEPIRLEPDSYSADIGFIGKNIRYIAGRKNGDRINFYTRNTYGPQDIVTTVMCDNGTYRLNLLSPYAKPKTEKLPVLQLRYEDKNLMDRYVAIQLQQIAGIDSTGNRVPFENYYTLQHVDSYNLDEYTRFNTVRETLIEYVLRVRVRTVGDQRRLQVFSDETKRFVSGNTLVLLDGVPIHNHDDILNYNPLNIKKMDVYNGQYIFGGKVFNGMVCFSTHNVNLTSIQLRDYMQLLEYNCPGLPEFLQAPPYNDKAGKESVVPDFRHTLYWNPFLEGVTGTSVPLSFYTSDLCGEFKVVVEGFTQHGEIICGTTYFTVKE